MRCMTWTVVLVAAALHAGPASAQAVAPPGQTDLSIDSAGGSDGLPIWMRPGGNEDVPFAQACVTPCRIRLVNGSYTLRAGDNREFDVAALGTPQYWDVEDDSPGLELGGVMGVGLGTAALMGAGIGILVLQVQGGEPLDGSSMMACWNVLAIGAVVVATGAVLWGLADGHADMLAGPPMGRTATVGYGPTLSPGLFLGRDDRGRALFGLGLRLTL